MGKCFRLREAERHEKARYIQVIERKSQVTEGKSLCDRELRGMLIMGRHEIDR